MRWVEHRRRAWEARSPGQPDWTLSVIRKHFIPRIGDVQLGKLRPVDIDHMNSRWRQDGMAESSVRRMHNLLHSALGQAVRWDLIATNPADRIERPQPAKSKRKAPSDGRPPRAPRRGRARPCLLPAPRGRDRCPPRPARRSPVERPGPHGWLGPVHPSPRPCQGWRRREDDQGRRRLRHRPGPGDRRGPACPPEAVRRASVGHGASAPPAALRLREAHSAGRFGGLDAVGRLRSVRPPATGSRVPRACEHTTCATGSQRRCSPTVMTRSRSLAGVAGRRPRSR